MMSQKKDELTRSVDLCSLCDISPRTLQNHIGAIRDYLDPTIGSLDSKPGHGYLIKVKSAAKFSALYAATLDEYQKSGSFNERSTRINYILSRLLSTDHFLLAQQLADEVFVSKSRLSSDLSIIRKTLKLYDLNIIVKPHHGIKVDGTEENKRRCIIRQNLSSNRFGSDIPVIENQNQEHLRFPKVKEIVTEALINGQLKVSDVVFQNIVIHISTSLHRMQHGHVVCVNKTELGQKYLHVMDIARQIVTECCKEYHS